MAASLSYDDRLAASSKAESIPWFVWCAVFSVTSAMVGAHWDISWHRSIGRDSFWTPAHIAIYLCGVLGGLSCGYLIFSRTFGWVEDRAVIHVWGFRAPLGAFLAAWGGVAMLTSAPFDDWWHNAYGLDVKIVSPPHVLLITGTGMVMLGALMLILGYMNRADGALRDRLNFCYLYIAAMLVVLLMILLMEFTGRPQMHQAAMYKKVAVAIPVVLAGVARASGIRWAATITAGVYSLFLMACIWVLPMFPAEPKLGPVYYPSTFFVPPDFPLLFLAPAAMLDLFWQRTQRLNVWLSAAVSGVLFLAVFAAVQWPFADFLMSPPSRNWFFGTHYFGYYTHPKSYVFLNEFRPTEADFWKQMVVATLFAMGSVRLGMGWGDWMRSLRR